MKLVIQNGCRHTLTRKEFEPILVLFPPKWNNGVNTITFYKSENLELGTRYFEKEKVLGVFWPKESEDIHERLKAISEILISLDCISENRVLCLDKSNLEYFLDRTASIREDCYRMLADKRA
ncbi:hypothetical protein Geob_0982 [Geotalea daltonii FRC-32]|uniref:Uncharacterized protein n=1 Tax=Geotalea daltonii (strain DSM 22248 / JCM 15807 / FRC-32) TaxID=316067 RepID=B9M2G5_GEODF|nr:hypothetical protein Geob_0982 [Geotalea daltonii FRC-32]